MPSNNSSATNAYQLVCGLEVHVELKTRSKMFCGCVNDPFNAPEPNGYTCPVCLGMPGGVPVANQKAIEWTLLLGLALGCQINHFSKFDRKHYFYPDLAKGYQISQYDLPFCFQGELETSFGPVKIRRIHLEEDTGKLLHQTLAGRKVSLIDFNRSGVPLVEIVTEANITSASQAKEYGKQLRRLLRYLDIADCDMEQGGMRLEANISLRPADSPADYLPDYKVEVKNINSFRFLEQAIEYEVHRQTKLLDAGQVPTQETRGWNVQTQQTFSQRTKESAEDYRYFPDPDLPPLQFTNEQIETLRSQLPTLPAAQALLWQQEYQVEPRFGQPLIESQTQTKYLTQLFEAATKSKLEANKLASDLVNGKLPLDLTKDVNQVVTEYQEKTATSEIDTTQLSEIIEQLKIEFPDELAAYQGGKTALLNFFMGQTMRRLGKKVSPVVLSNQVAALLKG